MKVSRRELRALAQAAALGLGFDYGTVEELARAVVWLSERSVDGLGALLDIQPSPGSGLQVGSDGPGLVDLLVGEVLVSAQPVERELTSIDSPLLLVGLCGIRNAEHLVAFDLVATGQANHVACRIERGAMAVASELRFNASLQLRASVSPISEFESALDGALDSGLDGALDVVDRPVVSTDRWQAAQDLATTTYVPSNERSRTLGAGAGLTDND